jgi:ATP-dependent Clp protease protease subunit
VKVMGLAASAASIIAMAGEERLIGPASFLMIHNCWVLAVGNRHDMAEVAEFLEPFDDAMAGVYADRAGSQEGRRLAKWMDAETWMSGGMAEERGFADRPAVRRRHEGRRRGLGQGARPERAAPGGNRAVP